MLKEYRRFKAAAVQAGSVYRNRPVFFDSAATLEKAIRMIDEAAGNGAKLWTEAGRPSFIDFP